MTHQTRVLRPPWCSLLLICMLVAYDATNHLLTCIFAHNLQGSRQSDLGHTPRTARTFRRKFRKKKTLKRIWKLSQSSPGIPLESAAGKTPNNSRHLKPPKHFQSSLHLIGTPIFSTEGISGHPSDEIQNTTCVDAVVAGLLQTTKFQSSR